MLIISPEEIKRIILLSVDNYIIIVRFVLIILMSLDLALPFVVVVLMFESD
jgi:hypothetical protein